MRGLPIVPAWRLAAVLLAALGLLLGAAWLLPTARADHPFPRAVGHEQDAQGDPRGSERSDLAEPTVVVAPRHVHQPEATVAPPVAAPSAPRGMDRSRDRRADLLDMARALRWHRGRPSGLPPGAE